LIGALALAAATHAGWRAALLAVLALPALAFALSRNEPLEAPPPPQKLRGTLPPAFWIAAAMVFCTTAAEWCVTGWGAVYAKDAAASPPATAVPLMGGYSAVALAARTPGSTLARRYPAHHLLAGALAITAIGFAILWPATTPATALAGLIILGTGL